MHTLVTGASGHVGGNLVRALLEEGRSVRALVFDDTRALDGLVVEQVRGDILDPLTLKEAMSGVDVVYHLAVVISVAGDPDGLMQKTNNVGTRNVVNACIEQGGIRLVHFSSIHAFSGHPADQMVDETREYANGQHAIPYDLTKVAGENAVMEGVQAGLDAVIVNPGGVIGPIDFKPSAMGEVLLAMCKHRMPGLVDAGFNWVDVRDVVAGAMAAEKRGGIGERYLLTGHWVPFPELADLVAKAAGVPRAKFVSPLWLATIGAPLAEIYAKLTGSRPLFTRESIKVLKGHRHVSNQKAKDVLGYKPRSIEETIKDTIDWYRQSGMF